MAVAVVGACSGAAAVSAGGVRELQVNLCDSGMASCYRDGRSTVEAAGLIRRYRPDVVTLNEVCARDVSGTVAAAMRSVSGQVFALFAPAMNRFTGMPYRCTDGDRYGIGMVGVGSVTASRRYVYRTQYAKTDEWRVALCADVGGTDFCTTHLESDDHATAEGQCHEFLRDVDGFRQDRPTVAGGDFNLVDLRGCLPAGWTSTGDGAVQHVLTDGPPVRSTSVVPMHDTDHPALLVDVG